MKIKINKHSSICINDNVYIDPLHLNSAGKAKYIFITHPHWDHFSADDINKIITKETIFICPKTMKDEISRFDNKVVLVDPDRNYHVEGLQFSTFRAYNLSKQYHPKENNWVGYNLNIEGENVAIVGDSDDTPELRKVKTDILIIPIGGEFTMNPQEAAEVSNLIHPKIVIPSHYGEVVGNKEMSKEFIKYLDKDIQCKILI